MDLDIPPRSMRQWTRNSASRYTRRICRCQLKSEESPRRSSSTNMTGREGRLKYCPAQSPDLNSIEQRWAYLKFQLREYDTRPSRYQAVRSYGREYLQN